MPADDTQKAISRLIRRYGSQAGAVPLPAAQGLRDALAGVPWVG